MIDLKTLGNNIRKVRQSRDLTQEDVACDIDISLTAYTNMERGITNIPVLRLMQLADYFEINVTEFFEPKENRPATNIEELANDIHQIKDELHLLTDAVRMKRTK